MVKKKSNKSVAKKVAVEKVEEVKVEKEAIVKSTNCKYCGFNERNKIGMCVKCGHYE